MERRLQFTHARVNYALKVAKALTPASRELIGNTVTTLGPDNTVSEIAVRALANLLTPEEVEKALPVFLEQKMTEKEAKGYAGWVKEGNPPETYDPVKAAKPKVSRPAHADPHQTPAHLANGHHPEPLAQPSHAPHLVGSGQVHPAHLSETGGLSLSGDAASHASAHLSPSGGHAASTTQPQAPPAAEKQGWFWSLILGIPFLSQLRSKYKKGEPLTTSEQILVGLYRLYGWVLVPIGKFCKWAGKGIWHSLKKAFGKVFGKVVEVLLPWMIVAGLVWGLLWFFHFAVISPWHWVEHKISSLFHHEDAAPEPAAVPTPVPAAVRNEELESASPAGISSHSGTQKFQSQPKTPNSALRTANSTPVASYQPAVSFAPPASPSRTLYDPKILEQEIAAMPRNSIVKDFPMTPDETMPGDLALSRLQDLNNADKYTMKIGDGTQKILSVNPTNTNLTVSYKSTDALGGLLGGGSGQMNFFWEDVKWIHVNEIDVQTKIPSTLYQCSLIVEGAKQPLTIQCASTKDLEHLVSTMEYFIRHSRLGRDTALAGTPYLSQGVRLDGRSMVDKLWENSPMNKTGLGLGYMVWSLEKNSKNPPDGKKLEAQLSALAPGPHDLFYASPRDLDNAARDTLSRFLNPKRRKVVLITT